VLPATVSEPDCRYHGAQIGAVRVFRGIRYGVAERFGLARRPTPAAEVDCSRFAPACPQPRGGPQLVPGLEPDGNMDEACLALNVWTPDGADHLPVIVWVHGGSFLIGTSASPTYDGTLLATDGAVVVSIQYRVGPFGFVDLRSVDDDVTPNAGLHDVISALEWVREHITAFGGDPHRVTVMGESAGGGVILHLLGHSDRHRWFDRAIVQSGSTGRTFDTESAALIARRFLAAAECDSMTELRNRPAEHLVAASVGLQSDPEVWASAGLMPFHPCVDGSLVRESPERAFARGANAGCDLVLGATRDEMQLFLAEAAIESTRLVRRVAKYLDLDEVAAIAVTQRYASAMVEAGCRAEPIDIWGAIYSDREMVLPARAALDAAAAAHSATFGYRFDWAAPPRPDGRPVGAAHGVDIPFSFGNFDSEWAAFLGGADRERRELSDAVRAAWIAFATTGDPTNSRTGTWPRWTAKREGVVFDRSVRVALDPLGVRGSALAS
jgi:para-nitrobenzyl esterase